MAPFWSQFFSGSALLCRHQLYTDIRPSHLLEAQFSLRLSLVLEMYKKEIRVFYPYASFPISVSFCVDKSITINMYVSICRLKCTHMYKIQVYNKTHSPNIKS